jgi:phosphoglucosamine mutase
MRNQEKRLFGTDGIRGTPGEYPLSDDMIFKIGRATARLLLYKKERSEKTVKIIIGKDTRQSCDRIEALLSKGMRFLGAKVIATGTISTPGLAFLTRHLNADMGLMISASHNRAEDNGIKFFSSTGYKLSVTQEKDIENLIFSDQTSLEEIQHCNSSLISLATDARSVYMNFLKSIAGRLNLQGTRIAVDCAHGALSDIAPQVFRELGAEVIAINNQPNGMNINQECGSLFPEVIKRLSLQHKTDIGFCYDGDGDRVILCDEQGNILDGDHIMGIIGIHWIKQDMLPKNSIVTTVMSNFALQETIENAGGKIIRTNVGDRNVTEELLKNSLIFGGEQSGHIIFLNHSTTGDAMITSLEILKVMQQTDKKLSQLVSVKKFPQILKNVRVREKRPFEDIPELRNIISQGQALLENKGRLLVRYSGTESVARIMVEGRDQSLIEQIASSIADSIQNKLGIKE